MVTSVAVISDIHGVLPALERVLLEPAVAGAELIVVTGDHTWGPQPTEVLDRLALLGDGAVLVRGNADRELLQLSRGRIVGFDPDPLSVWGSRQLSPAHQSLLEDMPEQATLDVDGFGAVRFCHATPGSDSEVVVVDSRIERWQEVFADLPAEVQTVVCGHSHMPFIRLVEGRLVVNSGSVGIPYGRSGAHWALLAQGTVSLGRSVLDLQELSREVVQQSNYPQVSEWVADYLRTPTSDVDAIEAFGRHDGR